MHLAPLGGSGASEGYLPTATDMLLLLPAAAPRGGVPSERRRVREQTFLLVECKHSVVALSASAAGCTGGRRRTAVVSLSSSSLHPGRSTVLSNQWQLPDSTLRCGPKVAQQQHDATFLVRLDLWSEYIEETVRIDAWGPAHVGLPRWISMTLSWSTYWKMCGASSRMPTVPAVVTAKKMYSCRRSITMATYFQSSRI